MNNTISSKLKKNVMWMPFLDKIAKNGYTSLTQDEKDFLFKNSR